MTFTTDPAVLSWMVALSPRPRPEPTGRHWWREMVTDAWFHANAAWEAERERVAIGYATEESEFAQHHPRPQLGHFMAALSAGRLDPARVYA